MSELYVTEPGAVFDLEAVEGADLDIVSQVGGMEAILADVAIGDTLVADDSFEEPEPKQTREPGPPIMGSLDMYLRELAAIPRTTREQEADLKERAAAGDLNARNKLVEGNLRLGVDAAKKFPDKNGKISIDAIQEANLALVIAANKVDPERDNLFGTYAYARVMNGPRSLKDEQASLIMNKPDEVNEMKKMRRIYKELCNELGRKPTQEELSGRTGLSVDRLQRMRDTIFRSKIHDLNAPLRDDTSLTLADIVEDRDTLSPEDEAIENLMRLGVNEALSDLTDIQKIIIEARNGFFGGKIVTHRQLAGFFGVSTDTIAKWEGEAMLALRESEGVQQLRDFID